MELLYASDYDSQEDVPLMFYGEKRKAFYDGEKDGFYRRNKILLEFRNGKFMK